MPNAVCPLCQNTQTEIFSQDPQRLYLQCQRCQLVFVARQHLLTAEQERQHYLLHNNDLQDPGYRQFLSKLAKPLLAMLGKGAKQGLDFGCGPGPLLAQMLTEAGHQMQLWDPFFANNPAALQQQYDFISCTEAIEHFVNPATEWQLWLQLLRPAGMLAIMTKCYPDATAFSSWHYKRDPTHISFFSEQTFYWLAQHYNLQLAFPTNDVVIFRKAG
ncbi:class I SAM-dependent methyltransferase [Alishewanella longhuensis]|uniref:class I SAM-dependent methyltransferase n=1 Tax=Alishewanella longhuensis TaxID=1091037 RepID=UPI0016785EC5|nr:class I SAM-dependent methyltransferase [Alishewanella longhuensis]